MNEKDLRKLLEKVRSGSCDIADAVKALKHWPAETLDFACLDHHRLLRTGFPEVVYGEDKSVSQIVAIVTAMLAKGNVVMVTRVSPEKAEKVRGVMPDLSYHESASMLIGNIDSIAVQESRGMILVIAAGTSDLRVADEAFYTAHYLGHPVKRLYDVGVAGIHRLLTQKELLHQAAVLIVAAGMEGALPSVVAGLVDRPVIAVPTSVGYGTSFGGLSALLGMLNSCAPGMAVVNIDNGFGAAFLASLINHP